MSPVALLLVVIAAFCHASWNLASKRASASGIPFIFLGAAGLATQFGGQAMINMAVNLNLMPSKGMTLPFVSHGGSSFLALSMGMGLLLALTRRNRFLQASPYVQRWRAA